MRVTVPSPALVTHSLPPATARSSGASADRDLRHAARPRPGRPRRRPTARPRRRRSPRPGCPAGARRERLALRRPVAASKRCSVPAVALATKTRPSGDRDAVGPAVGADRRRLGRAGRGAWRWRSGSRRPASSPATNAATASISAADSVPLNAGIVPLPLSTVALTVAALGLRSSRFGPTLPVVARRRERVAAAAVGGEDGLAGGRARPPRARPRRACRPSPRSASARRAARATAKAAASHVTGASTRSTLRSTSGRREAVLGDEPQPARQPRRDQEREQQAAGQRQRDRRAASASATITTLVANAP